MTIAHDLDSLDLNGDIFIHSPAPQPFVISRRRLENAIIQDRIFDYIGPAALWYTYWNHPELTKSEN